MKPTNTDARKAKLLPNGSPRYVRCYDNGGETFDRYTVCYTGRHGYGAYPYRGMSEHPFHPQGFGLWGEDARRPIDVNASGFAPAIDRTNHLGKRIPFDALPKDCKHLALRDYQTLWNL